MKVISIFKNAKRKQRIISAASFLEGLAEVDSNIRSLSTSLRMKQLLHKGSLDSSQSHSPKISSPAKGFGFYNFTANLACLCISAAVFAFTVSGYAQQEQVGRYITVNVGATHSQLEPLSQSVVMEFPSTIETTGQAFSYLLNNSGYQLAPVKLQNQNARLLFSHQLALSDRSIGPMTIQQALNAIAGPTYQVLVDPVHKFVSARVEPKFYTLYQTHVRLKK